MKSSLVGDFEAGGITSDAMHLSSLAVQLDRARLHRSNEPAEFVAALEENLRLWVAIKANMERADNPLPPALRQNLVKLADYVADTVMREGVDIKDSGVDTIININFQVCEGLLESRH